MIDFPTDMIPKLKTTAIHTYKVTHMSTAHNDHTDQHTCDNTRTCLT